MSETDLPEENQVDQVFEAAWDKVHDLFMAKHYRAGLRLVALKEATLNDLRDYVEMINDGYFPQDGDHAYDEFSQDGGGK